MPAVWRRRRVSEPCNGQDAHATQSVADGGWRQNPPPRCGDAWRLKARHLGAHYPHPTEPLPSHLAIDSSPGVCGRDIARAGGSVRLEQRLVQQVVGARDAAPLPATATDHLLVAATFVGDSLCSVGDASQVPDGAQGAPHKHEERDARHHLDMSH